MLHHAKGFSVIIGDLKSTSIEKEPEITTVDHYDKHSSAFEDEGRQTQT